VLRLVRRLRDGRREFALALFYARRLCEVRPSPRGERGFWAGGVGWGCDVVAPGAALAVMPCRLAGGRVALWVGARSLMLDEEFKPQGCLWVIGASSPDGGRPRWPGDAPGGSRWPGL
jgi:hypothetical protein